MTAPVVENNTPTITAPNGGVIDGNGNMAGQAPVEQPQEDAVEEVDPGTNDDGQEPGEDVPVEVLRSELTQARRDAARYRTELRAEQEKLKNAKTQADIDAAVASLSARITEMEHAALRADVARRHALPDALAARLQGSTAEELEADAAILAQLVQPANPRTPGRPKGGLRPNDQTGDGPLDPGKLAEEIEQQMSGWLF